MAQYEIQPFDNKFEKDFPFSPVVAGIRVKYSSNIHIMDKKEEIHQ